MINKDNATTLLGMTAIVVTLALGTCSTNSRIDDGFTNVNLRFDDMNRRIDDTNRRMDDGFTNVNQRIDRVESDIRELRTMIFELLKNLNPAD